MSGKLIVFEGTDGSGKSTQFSRLCARLEETGQPFQRLIFPQYHRPSSALLTAYLHGEYGTDPAKTNPYAASAFYAVDRYDSLVHVWGDHYRAGGLVLADRYTTSNAVHQACKLPAREREAFFDWLFDFECDKLGLPRPDGVLWLDMPTEQAVRLLRSRESATRTAGDIHELDAGHLALARETALQACEYFGWQRIPCVDANGQVRSMDDIHTEVWKVFQTI